MKYKVDGRTIEYFSEGEKTIGENLTLLNHAVDLTRKMTWHGDGYVVEKLFDKELTFLFEKNTHSLLRQLWKQAGLAVTDQIPLHLYHKATTQDLHLKAIDKTKLLSAEQFPIDIRILEKRISDILNQPMKVHNPFDDQKIFHFRVIRPMSGDNNPLHRDVWLEDYKDCINIYIPVAGSDEQSSLIMARGSHLWPESKIEKTRKGAVINGQNFNVPAVTNIFGATEFVRPNPQSGEVLVFSPYLIHGGSVNFHEDITRVSIEIRLWRQG